MKYTPLLTLIVTFSFSFPSAVDARIGESRRELEGRLLRSGGVIYRGEDGRAGGRKGGPYVPYLQYLGDSKNVRVYFKSDDGREPTQTDVKQGRLGSGWEVHVVYVKDESVLELYKRTGAMSKYEESALLEILAEGESWEEDKLTKESQKESPTAFGYNYVRSDGEVRAKKTGGSVMVFQRQLDENLAKQREKELAESAPQSVEGF